MGHLIGITAFFRQGPGSVQFISFIRYELFTSRLETMSASFVYIMVVLERQWKEEVARWSFVIV